MWGMYYLTTDWTAAMVNAQLFSGALTSPAKSGGYSNVGFVAVNGTTLTASSLQPAYMGGVPATPSGSLPVLSTDHSITQFPDNIYTLESNLWSLDENKELIPTWINPDGNSTPAEIGWGPDFDNGILITGNLTATREAFPDTPSTVQIVSHKGK
ncbi:hypothetical protein M407DRAFT_27869 [Tulasnella calospora MUT 4182]|uniref:Uncharacterized protein n=1 Tax=Tulasnella calospora MUT 4182 TaxID=1051891 RepID=A0A0C3LMM7_9AGAM|nr:hypothetical protein M407DRAFT_27869 [Tulasnella calospora MUT 4182]